MGRLRPLIALPFTLLGLLLIYISVLIGGERMANIILKAFYKNL